MPAPGKHLKKHFHTYPGRKHKKDKSRLAVWCNYCIEAQAKRLGEEDAEIRSIEALKEAARTEELSLPSRSLTLKKHLSSCGFAPYDVRSEYSKERQPKKEDLELQLNESKPFKPASQVPALKSEKEIQKEFNIELCKMVIETGSSWKLASHPAFHEFINTCAKLESIPHILSPQTLSGPILNQVLTQVESEIYAKIKGKLGTGQCDGWKNRSRTSLVASMVSVEGQAHLLHVHDVTAEIKSAKALLEIVLQEILHLSELDVTIVAWVSDAGGDSRAMRKRLAELMPRLIVLDCWAHQINLIVKDYLKLQGRHAKTAQDVIDVVKWFNGHSLALGLLRKQQQETLGKILALVLPCIARWTSHFLSARRLIRVENAMRACVEKNRDDLLIAAGKAKAQTAAAKRILDILEDERFWELLQELHDHLYPLKLAANMMQNSRGPLYGVTLTLANLYRTYDQDENLDGEVKDCLLSSIQKRWAKCDQDAFILALILNPYIRTHLFKRRTPFSTHTGVYTLVDRMWTRLFSDLHDPSLHAAVKQYCDSKGPFTEARMHLNEYKNDLREGEIVDLVGIWTYVVEKEAKEEIKQLGRLAIHIHSVVANSTDCERLFSTMGDIHTKQRNRLDHQRVRDMAVVKLALRRKPPPVQTKKEWIEEESQRSTPSTYFESCCSTMPDEENPVKQEVVEDSEMLQLLHVAEETDEWEQEEEVLNLLEEDAVESLADATALTDSDNEDSPSNYRPTAKVRSQLQIKTTRQAKTQEAISLPDLFDLRNNLESWDSFWKSG